MLRRIISQIKRTPLLFIISLLIGSNAFAGYDSDLIREIESWHNGDDIPVRLLKFPDGKIDTLFVCGLKEIGSDVRDYISKIESIDLLTALIFDQRSKADTFHAAVTRLITLKELDYVSDILRNKRKIDPVEFSRPEISVLAQLLQSPYISIQVSRIRNEDMAPEKAEPVLRKMGEKLNQGMKWDDAYRIYAEMYPDLKDRAINPRSIRTLICYLFDGTVSSIGFDIIQYCTVKDLPLEHLHKLFRAKHGTHIYRGVDGVYLYHIIRYYDGMP